MKIFRILVFLALAVAPCLEINAQQAAPRRVAVKAMAEISLTDGMSLSSALDLSEKKSSVNNFGIEFGYKFMNYKRSSLDINVGFGYDMIRNRLGVDGLEFHYAAGPEADEDGNRYVRYYEDTDLWQSIETKSFSVPLYLTYDIACCKWLSFHIDAGAQFRFNTASKIKDSSAQFYTYGIYPEYDNLMIDAAWLNGFGQNSLNDTAISNVETNSLNTALIFGAGLEFRLGGPVWVDLGVRYSHGLNDIYVNQYSDMMNSSEDVPVTYTVADGEVIKPLSGYLSKSVLSNLSLRAGLVFRF